MRVSKAGGCGNLPLETLESEDRGEFGFEDLERYVSPVLEVLREVHVRHPPFAEQMQDPVAAGERTGELLGEVGHSGDRTPE